jgi:hypothetical protein
MIPTPINPKLILTLGLAAQALEVMTFGAIVAEESAELRN